MFMKIYIAGMVFYFVSLFYLIVAFCLTGKYQLSLEKMNKNLITIIAGLVCLFILGIIPVFHWIEGISLLGYAVKVKKES